jgi:hypothetical protein
VAVVGLSGGTRGVSTPYSDWFKASKTSCVKAAAEIPQQEALRKLRRRAQELGEQAREWRAKLVAMRAEVSGIPDSVNDSGQVPRRSSGSL